MRRKKTVETLTEKDKVAIMTNDPQLSEVEVTFGDKTYKLVDLPYDEYMKFMVLLQPFLEAVVSKFTGTNNLINFGDLLSTCGESIPELAYISLKQVDPDITINKIKEIGKSPFRIVPVVIKQIEKNKMIQDISDFFGQILPLIHRLG